MVCLSFSGEDATGSGGQQCGHRGERQEGQRSPVPMGRGRRQVDSGPLPEGKDTASILWPNCKCLANEQKKKCYSLRNTIHTLYVIAPWADTDGFEREANACLGLKVDVHVISIIMNEA